MNNFINLPELKKTQAELGCISEDKRNRFLRRLSAKITENENEIISANREDVRLAKSGNLDAPFVQRLTFGEKEIKAVVEKLLNLQKILAGLGTNIEIRTRRDGLRLKKVRVPIGIILVIYESRPEVTVDVSSLCLKSGNAAILKGGSEALNTNKVLFSCISESLNHAGINGNAVQFIDTNDRKITDRLLEQSELIDLVIARGGYGMVRQVIRKSRIPVLAHAAGGSRIYVDKSADLNSALRIIINAKTTKPAACNSVDTVLVHREIEAEFMPKLIKSLKANEIKIIENVWDEEFLRLAISIKTVKDISEATEFINKHGKRHSEGIIAEDKNAVLKFCGSVDSAAVFVNCSTRLHDGYEFGLGSEMGISTGKLHARGPVGLKELTTYKWIVEGEGHVRK